MKLFSYILLYIGAAQLALAGGIHAKLQGSDTPLNGGKDVLLGQDHSTIFFAEFVDKSGKLNPQMFLSKHKHTDITKYKGITVKVVFDDGTEGWSRLRRSTGGSFLTKVVKSDQSSSQATEAQIKELLPSKIPSMSEATASGTNAAKQGSLVPAKEGSPGPATQESTGTGKRVLSIKELIGKRGSIFWS